MRLIENEVKPWVDIRIKEEMRSIQVMFNGFEYHISRQLDGIQALDLEGVKVKLDTL